MSFLEALWTVGSIGGIIALFITVFMWFHISPQQLTHFLVAKRKTIFNVTYITLISAFTMFYVLVFTYVTIAYSIFTFQWALLLVIVAFSAAGLWSPILMNERLRGGRFKKIAGWILLVFSITIFVGFWIISWPTDLLTPSILTGAIVIVLVAYYLYRYWSRVKAKTIRY